MSETQYQADVDRRDADSADERAAEPVGGSAEKAGPEGDRGSSRNCPECGGLLVPDTTHGETVCAECGLVVAERAVDYGPEWRAYNAAEDHARNRGGAPTTPLRHDKGLTTTIDWQNKDAYGRALSPQQYRHVQRLRTWDERFVVRNNKERNLKQALAEIDRMASSLSLPRDVRETAGVIYRRALEESLLPGRSIEAIATSALYAAARQAGTPRSISEVTEVSRVDELEFKRAYRYLVRELGLAVQLADPRNYVRRFVSDLDLSPDTERVAKELLDVGDEHHLLDGRSPVALAAAAVYAAASLADEGVTQAQVSRVADVSDVTIRTRYKELLRAAEHVPSP
ncbi:transcription initiation factor IIB [Halomarina litorea]|uniref:transcription initiation factor IIB n=1 Tax=Halomarina litorea TaxID=2961595 RepID=UPI0020C25CEB|nr:TFIIB-type zinc ribbon-containing protein [Halomarina sp. BCD28]